MGSFRNCEIVEARDDQDTDFAFLRNLKSGHNKSLDDDIHKLFESVNFGTSKGLDLLNSSRNASKSTIRAGGSRSPGIGFSEPVSLKQALRGLCISQAAEMAAIKRSSLPGSPRISEAGKISSMCRSVVVETSNLGQSSLRGGERRIEISLVPEEVKSAPHSFHTSPICGVKPAEHSEAKRQLTRIQKDGNSSFPDLQHISNQDNLSKQDEGVSFSNKFANVPCEDSVVSSAFAKKKYHDNPPKQDELITSSKNSAGVARKNSVISSGLSEKAAPKLRRKARLQAVVRKDLNSTRSMNRGVRPVVRNKIIVIKKVKKVAPSTDVNSKASPEVKTGNKHGSEPLVCDRCQCFLRDTIKDPSSVSPIVGNSITEKGDICLSSMSRAYDFSSSSASLSDESNLSTSDCSNKPHMSKDVKWKAISHVRKRYGSLGLSHFSLIKKLGSGDIGTVYLAQLLETNCQFAIKVMDTEFLARRKKMPRAQTEREILKMLDHPFLPTLYAQFTSDNLSCLVMEFCPGGDLHVLRQKQPNRYFPEHATRFYVAEVLLALEYLHMLGIVYRDLKPENILVREDGHIMLTDFDLSLICSVTPILMKPSSVRFELPRVSGQCSGSNCIDPFCTAPSCRISCFSPRLIPTSATTGRKLKGNGSATARSLPQLVAEPTDARSNSFVGTHEYLAPEIVKGEGHGSAVDWWTVGIFLYELLYGRTPFKGSGNEETLTNVVLQNLKFPDYPIVSFQARDLIRSLLVKDPESRLGTKTGAAEIKRHPFFHGLNWALVRSSTPPHISGSFGNSRIQKGETFVEYANGEQLEFGLF